MIHHNDLNYINSEAKNPSSYRLWDKAEIFTKVSSYWSRDWIIVLDIINLPSWESQRRDWATF